MFLKMIDMVYMYLYRLTWLIYIFQNNIKPTFSSEYILITVSYVNYSFLLKMCCCCCYHEHTSMSLTLSHAEHHIVIILRRMYSTNYHMSSIIPAPSEAQSAIITLQFKLMYLFLKLEAFSNKPLKCLQPNDST